MIAKELIALRKKLHFHDIETTISKDYLECRKEGKQFSFWVNSENPDFENRKNMTGIPFDYIARSPEKVISLILSKLQLNKKVFARKCELKKVNKITAVSFLNQNHLMDATQSGFNLGLYHEDELIALASFSKGRKMNRLQSHERSYELIRFCTKSGITVTGGLTRLIKKFCEDRKAGDIMTYIDKQLYDGRSFIAAGFNKESETLANYFLVNRITFERMPCKKDEKFDARKYYLTHNSGSIKLVYTPGE